jgi:hypothetical protein
MDAWPSLLGRFEVQRVLQRGFAGALCVCRDPDASQTVLVTMVRATDVDARHAWRSAARQLARVAHPQVARAIEDGDQGDFAYFAVEHPSGDTLAALIGRAAPTAWPLDGVLGLGASLCQTLEDLRELDVTDVDLRPEALWITDEGHRVLLLSPPLPDEARRNVEARDEIERVDDGRAEAASVFAVGALLYELITGQAPARVNLHQHRTGEQNAGLWGRTLVPLGAWDRETRQIVMRAMADRPEDRYPSLRSLREDLEALIGRARPSAGARYAPVIEPAPSEARPAASSPTVLDENVQFTVYRPARLDPGHWQTLLAFAHLSEKRPGAEADEPDPVEEVARQAAALLGDTLAYRQHTEDSLLAVPREGEVTFVPHVEGVEFNPPRRSFVWTESVHREAFRLRAAGDSAGQTRRGRMTVYLGSIVLAEIGMTFTVGAAGHTAECEPRVATSAQPYRRIFASYSHRDLTVVREYAQYAQAMGDRYLQDVIDLRSGERWQPALEELIRSADVFQLFWSWNALESRYVWQEVQFALDLNRASFIRPVYWDDPLPSRGDLPPDALRALHFERIPTRTARAARRAQPAAPASTPEAKDGAVPDDRQEPPARTGTGRMKSWKATLSALAALAIIAIMIPTVYRPSSREGDAAGPAAAGEAASPPAIVPAAPAPPPSMLTTLTVAVGGSSPAAAAAPRAAARVRVEVVLRRADTQEIVSRAEADANGFARFPGVPPGTYVVSAARSGMEDVASASFVLGDRPDKTLELTLPARGTRGAIERQNVRPGAR